MHHTYRGDDFNSCIALLLYDMQPQLVRTVVNPSDSFASVTGDSWKHFHNFQSSPGDARASSKHRNRPSSLLSDTRNERKRKTPDCVVFSMIVVNYPNVNTIDNKRQVKSTRPI